MGLKENWNKEDIVCPNCKQVTERVRGLTKQNLKRLMTPTWNMNEMLILFMIIMIAVLAFSYNKEIKTCKEWLKPMFISDNANCISVCNYRCEGYFVGIKTKTEYQQPQLLFNLTNQSS
jgi:hypothetical protein